MTSCATVFVGLYVDALMFLEILGQEDINNKLFLIIILNLQ
jgi:hypothetical protein